LALKSKHGSGSTCRHKLQQQLYKLILLLSHQYNFNIIVKDFLSLIIVLTGASRKSFSVNSRKFMHSSWLSVIQLSFNKRNLIHWLMQFTKTSNLWIPLYNLQGKWGISNLLWMDSFGSGKTILLLLILKINKSFHLLTTFHWVVVFFIIKNYWCWWTFNWKANTKILRFMSTRWWHCWNKTIRLSLRV
jgi:hypothetical protein